MIYDGYICNYGVVYSDHYMIAPGALKESNNVPITYTPENSSPEFIGSAELESDSCGMLAHCQILDDYAGLVDLLKSGEYDLGFTATKVEYTTDDKGVRYYTQGTIRNVGILPYPYNPRVKPAQKSNEGSGEDFLVRSKGRYIDLDLAKNVIAKFKGYLDEDMILRIQIALEKESKAENE